MGQWSAVLTSIYLIHNYSVVPPYFQFCKAIIKIVTVLTAIKLKLCKIHHDIIDIRGVY